MDRRGWFLLGLLAACAGPLDAPANADGGEEPSGGLAHCTPGASEPCGFDEGECVAGVRTCTSDDVWTVCEGDKGPSPEACDGLDNDCNGAVDDGCGCDEGAIEACVEEASCSAGSRQCAGGVWTQCMAPVAPVQCLAGVVVGAPWVRRNTGGFNDATYGVAVAPDGSVYVTGNFSGSATFGQGEPTETTLSTGEVGLDAVFVARYSSCGGLVWVRSAGGAHGAAGAGIALAPNGEVVVVGAFNSNGPPGGTATFGEGEPNATTLASEGSYDAFVARYTSCGALVWARGAGGVSDEAAVAVAVAADDTIAVAGGMLSPTAVFGAGTPGEVTVAKEGNYAYFVASYGGDGSLSWVRHGTSADPAALVASAASAVAVTSDGGLAVTGTYGAAGNYNAGTVTFGGGAANSMSRTSVGGYDVFLARYTKGGDLSWVRVGGGQLYDAAGGVAAGADGSLYVSGTFGPEATFNAGEPDEATIQTGGDPKDAFIARYDASGTLQWIKPVGSTLSCAPDDAASGAAIGPTGDIYFAGAYNGGAVFGAGEPTEAHPPGVGSGNSFVARYTPEGAFVGMRGAGIAAGPLCLVNGGAAAVAVGGDSSVAVVGSFSNDTEFWFGDAAPELMKVNSAAGNAYIAKLYGP